MERYRILTDTAEGTQFAAVQLSLAERHHSRNAQRNEELSAQSQMLPSKNDDGFQPICTVVVCTRNRPTELNSCLQGLAQLVYSRFDVLVVDNAPSDERARDVAVRWGARYIVEPATGLSRARNRGARACNGEIVAFLDDDSVPDTDWLSSLVREFNDPSVMAVTGRIIPFCLETEAQRIYALMAGANSNGHRPRVIDHYTPAWFELANFGGIGDGGNMAFRRRAFDVWPGFDERLGRGAPLDGGEEHNAFFSLLDRGYRIRYTPDAVVRHPFIRSMSALRDRQFKDLASAVAYITLLFAEQPRYRRALLEYVLGAARGTTRAWRGQTASPRPRILPWWRLLLAWVSGPFLYGRSLLSDADDGKIVNGRRKWTDLLVPATRASNASRSGD